MNNWKPIILGDFIETITDYHANGAYSKLKENIELKYEEDYAIMIRTLNFESNDFENKLIYLNEREYNYLSKSKVYANDIVMNKIANPGTVYLMPKLDKPVSLAMNLFLIRFNKDINQVFVFHLMKMNENYIKRFANGTTTKSITKDSVRALKFKVPNLETQKQIAKFLSDLDAKIEVNNKINQELEAMAKTLYDYWFVQFDFPDKNGKPYKSSGGEMVFNEELKREIPEGWEACELGDVVNKTGTGLNPRKNFKLGDGDNFYVTIKNIEQGKVNLNDKCDRINDEALKIINNRSDLRKGDILYTSIQPVGTTYLIREEPKNWNINESVFTIRPNIEKVTSEFLYMFVSGDYIKKYTNYVSAGSIHKGVRHSTLKECKFILPPKNVVNQFTNIVKPMLDKDYSILKENRKLSELRDWLLPMLMNGQVSVAGLVEESLGLVAEEGVKYGEG